eukprot:TRINITY_DN1220_c0_g1_i1.p1 TRINITY_DN1220_c0_g1~~TRINITY_DN1220_c0_g1_i1.p1  ORF type:complete len:468 (+),score=156.59 TRINITY_DN1220_c0_g1_i1:153-1556(+)
MQRFSGLRKSLSGFQRFGFSTNKIVDIKGREILDSRGNPTVEADIITSKGVFRAAVPSGASTGIYEALELRDGDKSRYLGKGVQKAVENINRIIAPALRGLDVTQQVQHDTNMVQSLDGSRNQYGWSKGKLGANAILAVSLALARAGAAHAGVPLYTYINRLAGKNSSRYYLPVPCLNVINGGKHAGNRLAMQEFMILPTGARTFREAMQIGCEVYHNLKKIIQKKYGMGATNVGDEGGFAPDIVDSTEGLALLAEAIQVSGHQGKVELAMDVAASEFFIAEGGKKYDLDFKNPKSGGREQRTPDELIALYEQIVNNYPVISIEDPFDQDDWDSYSKLRAKLGDRIQIVGDDLLVTNPVRIEEAKKKNACNALLLKVNQIGSVTESIEASNLSRSYGWGVMVSHRSGETEDNTIADIVVGLSTGQIKTGAPCRSDRLAKYNQLLRIEEELGQNAVYAGKQFRNPSNL